MRQTVKKLFELLSRRDTIIVVVLVLMMIAGAILEIVGLSLIPGFVLALSNPELIFGNDRVKPVLDFFAIQNKRDLLIVGAIVLIGIFILKNVYLSVTHYYKSKFIAFQQKKIGERLFSLYMNAPYEFYLNRNSSELLRNVISETMIINNGILTPLLNITMNGLVIIAIASLLLYIEPLATLSTFFFMGTTGFLFLRLTSKKLKLFSNEEQVHRSEKNRVVVEGISGIKEVRILNRENAFIANFEYRAARNAKAQMFRDLVVLLPKPIIETVAIGGILLITLVMLYSGKETSAIIPMLTLFGAAAVRLMPVLNELMVNYSNLKFSLISMTPVYNDLTKLETSHSARNENVTRERVYHGDILIDNISYTYPGASKASVKNISLKIPQGKSVAFVGSSGAGKTTLVDIVLGLLTPQSGHIEVEGVDITSNIQSWRKSIGYIPQNIYLTDDTIRRNIALGLPDEVINDENIDRVLKLAHLEIFVSTMPEGVNSWVGERGVRLSGGQRQRIGIARALYNDPSILIMDEATSALDNQTERYIVESIDSLKGSRTLIIIAHRLTTIMGCDIIFYMNDGKVVDQGTYEYLMKNNEEFRKLATT